MAQKINNSVKPFFSQAIVRTPCKRMVEGITSANLGIPDYTKALEQHEAYIRALETCGLAVTVLPADEGFPDSTFVEDTALLTTGCAVITRPGAASRRGETDAIRKTVTGFFSSIESISAPGTVEAGDIMMVGDTYYIGLSERTNPAGGKQMISILRRYGMDGVLVPMKEMLHLKTGVNYIENNTVLVTGEFVGHPLFKKFRQIQVPPQEAYAANSVWINDRVLVPEGYPRTREMIASAGFETLLVDTSEFRRLDGGLSCLSLRF